RVSLIPCTTKLCLLKGYGTHQFKVIGYNQNIYNFPISSGTFNIGGYDWRLVYYPRVRSRNEFDNDDYIEVDLELLSKAEVRVMVDLFFFNQITNLPYAVACTKEPMRLTKKIVWAACDLMKLSELESSGYVRDDSIIIQCQVTVILLPGVPKTKSLCEIEVPPPEMAQQFGMLLEDMASADVTFEVGGKSFHAHRLVLAARSPVFKAQLFGSMRDTRMESLVIGEMDPAVFKALLHYIYNESLPNMDSADRANRHEMLCHLLEAADRYAIERLKIICERMLLMDLDVENVAMTLALAEQQHCKQLTHACLEFMEPPEKMEAVVATEGYNKLKREYPALLFKVWEWSVHRSSKN
uniref:BTB domain-containing protein n=1 Tax=Setaria italica TaxID=4555 RepID=K3YME9_SETIT